MTFRQWVKYQLYGTRGSFSYFGNQVYFPRGSTAFKAACEQGIFEADNVRVLQHLCRPRSCVFDVGANLGLMALPILSFVPDVTVVSFEPSPNTLPWLRRTVASSKAGERWQLVEKAVARSRGTASFSVSVPTEGLYDGLMHTGRAMESRKIEVAVTSLDFEWKRMGCPGVSIIKIDVEGGEIEVLRGAEDCLSAAQPFVLLEWCLHNLRAYNIPLDSILQFACEYSYQLYALPAMIPVTTTSDLELQVIRTESFLLAPRPSDGRGSQEELGIR